MIKQLNRLASSWGCRCDSEYVDDALDAICDNIPFGKKTEMVEIVPQQSVTGEYSGEPPIPIPPFYGYAFNNPNLSPLKEEGTIYIVSINGISYEVENKGDGLMIDKDDKLFFAYNRIPEDMFEGGQWDPSLGETITLAIYEKQEIVKQIDPKFVGGGVPLYVDGYRRLYFDKDLTKGVTKAEIKDLFINGKNLIIVNGNPAFDGVDNYFKITQVVDGYGEDYAEAWICWAFDHLNIHSTTYYTIEKEVSSGDGEQ